jgi:hypothetical protein
LQHEDDLPLPWRDRGLDSTDNGGGVRGEEEEVSERKVVSVGKKKVVKSE